MIIGKGSETEILSEAEVTDLCAEAFSRKNLDGKRILFIIPDYTRSCPLDVMFRVVYKLLAGRLENLDPHHAWRRPSTLRGRIDAARPKIDAG